jgi:hypothetical protein
MPLLFDIDYILLVIIPTAILSGLAQMYLRNAYSKWNDIRNAANAAGPEVAQRIKQVANLNVSLERSQGQLSDHYDPSDNSVAMSPDVANRASVASMAIMAHELGHAEQYKDGSLLIQARSFLVPAVSISPTLSYALIFGGLLFGASGLAWLGVGVFAISVLFMLLTLPVEFDASRRGMKLLKNAGLLADDEERSGAKQVLTAAALTYVAAAVTSLLQLLYFVSLVNRRD